jgi:hypothetical protein
MVLGKRLRTFDPVYLISPRLACARAVQEIECCLGFLRKRCGCDELHTFGCGRSRGRFLCASSNNGTDSQNDHILYHHPILSNTTSALSRFGVAAERSGAAIPKSARRLCSAIRSSVASIQKKRVDGIQAGQSAAETRITAQRQDLTLRNIDLEPIFGLVAYRPPKTTLSKIWFRNQF